MMQNKVQRVDIKTALYSKAAAKGIPLGGTFELTPLCNFNCRMCYIHMTQQQLCEHNGSMMQLADWLAAAEQARQLGTLYLLLTGGEPLLWHDFWKLYNTVYQMGFLLSVNTNGSLITDEVIQRFVERPPYRVNITLYGASDETYQRLCGVHGMYDRVIHAIEGLQDAGIMVKLNGSVTPDNVDDLEQMLRYADGRGLVFTPTAYMFPPLRKAPEQIGSNNRFTPEKAAEIRMQILRHQMGQETYERFLKNVLSGMPVPMGLDDCYEDSANGRIQCTAGRATFWATWNGYISMCGMIPDERVSLKELGLEQAWNAVRKISLETRLSDTCSQCSSRRVCNACAAMALTETGSVSGIPKYLCRMAETMKEIAERELGEGCKQ